MWRIGKLIYFAELLILPGTTSNNTYVIDAVERRNNALLILKYLCESPVLAPHLKELLSARLIFVKLIDESLRYVKY